MSSYNPPPDFPRDPGAPTQTPYPPTLGQSPASAQAQHFTPTVTLVLIAITVGIYILQYLTQYMLGIDLPAALGEKNNTLIMQGQLWRLLTPMFLHGSILHIGFNMYALYIFGPGLERHFGRLRYLALYLISGFAGNVISFIFSPYPSLGSSTSIFGLLGAEGVFLYRNRRFFGGMARTALTQIVMIAAINLVIGLSPGIDNWGHVGGLFGGILFTWLAGPLLVLDGIPPYAKIHDDHGRRDLVLGGIAVAALFAIIASARILNIL